jgi:hypothetical protein
MQTSSAVYVRTPLGRSTAFNPSSKLAEPLRSMLKAVDGKLSAEALAAQFAEVDDVSALLSQLEDSGLIADRGSAWPKVELKTTATAAAPPPNFVASASSLLEPGVSVSAELSESMFGNPVTQAPPVAWSDTAASSLDQLPVPQYSLLDRMAQQAADVMCTFVLTHLPGKAFGLLGEIEKIRTPDELKHYLSGYETEIASAGQTGQDHLAEIKQVLQKLF